MQSNDAAERLLHHDDIATGRKLSNFNIPSIKMEAYIAAILNSIKDGQDIKQVPPAAFFNRTEEEVIANMEESRELDEQWAPQKKTCALSAEKVGLVLNIRIVHNNLHKT